MGKPIVEFKRGVPKDAREWNNLFEDLAKFLRVSGDQLEIGGDVALPPSSVGTAELEDDGVTNAKLRDSLATSVMGRAAATGGNPADIIAGTDGHYLRRTGGTLSFGAIADADLPSTIARDTEVSAAVSAHEAAVDPHPTYTTAAELSTAISNHEAAADPHTVYPLAAGAEVISGAWSFGLPVVLPNYTVATVPSAATYVRGLIYVSDETGGAVPAFSDGTNWRRVTDRAVVA